MAYKSAIAFGLVYVPISLHPCIKNNDIGFNMLYKKTGQRIKYKKTCEDCPANVKQEDIFLPQSFTAREIEPSRSAANQ